MEQPQLDGVTREYADDGDLRLVECPAGSQETAVLIAVGIVLLHRTSVGCAASTGMAIAPANNAARRAGGTPVFAGVGEGKGHRAFARR
jgi:hypothetical protein